jgi:hypothetical protein
MKAYNCLKHYYLRSTLSWLHAYLSGKLLPRRLASCAFARRLQSNPTKLILLLNDVKTADCACIPTCLVRAISQFRQAQLKMAESEFLVPFGLCEYCKPNSEQNSAVSTARQSSNHYVT